jgi:hypothetical protein
VIVTPLDRCFRQLLGRSREARKVKCSKLKDRCPPDTDRGLDEALEELHTFVEAERQRRWFLRRPGSSVDELHDAGSTPEALRAAGVREDMTVAARRGGGASPPLAVQYTPDWNAYRQHSQP